MSRTSPRSNRLLRFWPLAVAFIIVIAYGLFWREGSGEMRRSIESWAEAQRAHGVEVSFERVATTGFPFVWRGAVGGASIAQPSVFRWSAGTLYVEASPFSPNSLAFKTDNSQTIDLGQLGVWRIDAPDGRARIEGGRSWKLDVRSGRSLIERTDGGARIASESFRLTVAPDASAQDQVQADVTIDRLSIDGLARRIEAPVIEAVVALAPAAGGAGEGGPQSPGAGELVLRRVHVEFVGATLDLSGALTLDPLGRPEGALDAEIVNPGAIATLLGDLGAISREDADQAAASLSLAALASGGKITAPLILKDGYATIAGVAVARLPRFDLQDYAPTP